MRQPPFQKKSRSAIITAALLCPLSLSAATAPVIDTTDPTITTNLSSPINLKASYPVVIPDLKVDIREDSSIIVVDDGVTFNFTPTGDIGPLMPGQYIMTWKATDLGLNSFSKPQTLNILPSINLGIDQQVGEGGTATVTAYLSGKAANYPFTINFNISGSNSGAGVDDGSNDHSLTGATTSLTFNEGELEKSIAIDIYADPDTGTGETIILTLDNASIPPPPASESVWTDQMATKSHTITITQPDQNHTPLAQLHAEQNGNTTRIIAADAGKVTICAMPDCGEAYDANGATLQYDWSASDNALIPTTGTTKNSFEFETQGLNPGFYTIRLTVSDTAGKASSHDLLLRLFATGLVLTDDDSDGDDINDNVEGFYDNDNDGIPNYLDSIEDNTSLMQAYEPYLFDSNIKQEDSVNINSIELNWALSSSSSNLTVYPLLIASEPGIRIHIGPTAFAAEKTYARLETSVAEALRGASLADGIVSSDGQVIDIEITNLNSVGDSALIVLPQAAPIPTPQSGSPTFITFRNTKTWEEFATDANNEIKTVKDKLANSYCPGLDDVASYVDTLAKGDDCLLIKIEDGGANDYDRIANGTIRLMGAVFISSASVADNSQAEGGIFTGDTDAALEGDHKLNLGTGGGSSLGFISLAFISMAGLSLTLLRRSSKKVNQ